MRDFLDSILGFIDSESLTDEEWGALSLEEEQLSKEVYAALLAVLEARDGVSDSTKRLKHYFLAAGIDLGVEEDAPATEAKSNILIGTALE